MRAPGRGHADPGQVAGSAEHEQNAQDGRRGAGHQGRAPDGFHTLPYVYTPDLKPAQDFYGEFGLTVTENGNRLQLTATASPHVWGTVGEGVRKKHQYVSFGVFEEDFEPFARRLQAMGVPRLDPPSREDRKSVV